MGAPESGRSRLAAGVRVAASRQGVLLVSPRSSIRVREDGFSFVFDVLPALEGEAKGTYEIRFCHYDHRGRFQRSPLIVDEKDLPELRKALLRAPKLRHLLGRLLK